MDNLVQKDGRLVSVLVLKLFGLRDSLEEVENLFIDRQPVIHCFGF